MVVTSLLLSFQEYHRQEASEPSPVLGTMTSTATREEKDQDPQILAGTKTILEGREGADQDPNPPYAGTATGTRAKEEPDQDPHHSGYYVFPRG